MTDVYVAVRFADVLTDVAHESSIDGELHAVTNGSRPVSGTGRTADTARRAGQWHGPDR